MSDPWEQLRYTTLDAMITTTKMEGSAAILHGYTTPERWPYVVVVAIGSPGNERALELAQEFHGKLRTAGATLNVAESNPKCTVHYLHHGRALCGFSPGVLPGQWPAGHMWTYVNGIGGNCEECRSAVKVSPERAGL